MAYGNLRRIAAYGEIGSRKLVKNDTILTLFWRPKDQPPRWGLALKITTAVIFVFSLVIIFLGIRNDFKHLEKVMFSQCQKLPLTKNYPRNQPSCWPIHCFTSFPMIWKYHSCTENWIISAPISFDLPFHANRIM